MVALFKPGFHMIATIAAQRSQRSLRSLRAYGNIHSAIFAIVATLDRNDRRDFSISAIVVLRSLRSYGNQALTIQLHANVGFVLLTLILKCSMPTFTSCFSIYFNPKIYIYLRYNSLHSLATHAVSKANHKKKSISC